MTKRNLISSSLMLMLLAACSSQTANLPAGPNPAAMTASGSQTSQPASPVASNQTTASSTAQAGLDGDLTSVYEDEAFYSDTVLLADSEAGFSTQALGAGADARIATMGPVRKQVARSRADLAKAKAKDALTISPAERARFKQRLVSSGAVTVNADGTLTVDKAQFSTLVNAGLEVRKTRLKRQLDSLGNQLEPKRDIAADKLRRLHHHDHKVRISDKTTVTNPDGSITETIKVNFANSRTDVIRETILAKTSLNGKLINVDYQLKIVTPAFEHTKTRVATHNNDGSKTVLIDAKTVWRNGKTRERHEERLIEADGSGKGTGTIKVTMPDGSVKTWQYTLSFTADGKLTTSASDGQTETLIEADAQGDATVIVTENGVETATEVNLDAEAAASGI